MLSRASILSGHNARIFTGIRASTSSSTCPSKTPTSTQAAVTSDSGERDLVNFPRPVRLIEPGKVRMGLIPEEWFQFFYKKTGVTGPYMFGVGFTTYLVSKEIYVMEHEYYSGLSFALLCILGVKYLGPMISKYADKEVKEFEDGWNSGRIAEAKFLADSIKAEETEQWRADGQEILMEAKKENIALQLEAAYRERLLHAFNEVKRRLDFQVEKQEIERRVAQKNLVQYVVNQVLKSITPDQEKENLNRCIADLGALAIKK